MKGLPVLINLIAFSENSEKETAIDFLSKALDAEDIKHKISDFSGIEEGLKDNYREYINTTNIWEESVEVSIVLHPNILQYNYNKTLVTRRSINLYILNSRSIWGNAESSA